MPDYAKLHFKNYIPDKDINGKILTENPVPSNLQEVSQTAITTDYQMEKFQENFLQVMGPFITTLERIGRCSKQIF